MATNTRDKLEKKIFEKPEDIKRHEAYIEWLKENGDEPRAELVELQVALESTSHSRERRFELHLQEQRLLNQHGREWIGPLANFILMKELPDRPFQPKPGCRIEWYRGWVYGLQLDELTLKLSKVLLQAPELRMFRKLVLIEPVNASCDYLHEWGLLDRIKILDISYGRITDKGALTLAADRSIKKLDVLDMRGNQISEEGIAAITKSFPKVLIDDQNPIVIQRDEAVETVEQVESTVKSSRDEEE